MAKLNTYVFDYIGLRVIKARSMEEAMKEADYPPDDYTFALISHNDRMHKDDELFEENADGW